MLPQTVLYLDQNYISRIAKYTLEQPNHEDFGQLYLCLQRSRWFTPASPFHALETAGSYLLPTVQTLLEELSKGYWFRSWQDILLQQRTTQSLNLPDILTTEGSWDTPVDVEPFVPLLSIPLEGHLNRRIRKMSEEVRLCLGMLDAEPLPPFAEVLAKLIAFRSRNSERQLRPSDLVDIIMAASLAPYSLHIATDRFVREALDRLGYGEHVYCGRKTGVQKLYQVIAASIP